MFQLDNGVTHHGEPDEVDHDADAAHTAVFDDETEEFEAEEELL